MGGHLRVDVDAVRLLAASTRGEADRIAGLDPTGPVDSAAAAVPGSSIGAAAARAGAPLLAAYRDTTERLRAVASAAESNAGDYAATEQSFRLTLDAAAEEF